MELSPLFRLPPELREEIYSLVFRTADYIIDLSTGFTRRCCRNGSESSPLAVAQTCRQVRSESLPLFFSSTHFMLLSKHTVAVPSRQGALWITAIRTWISLIGPENYACTTDVEIVFDCYDLLVAESYTQLAERMWENFGPLLGLFTGSAAEALKYETWCRKGTRMMFYVPLRDAEMAESAVKEIARSVDLTRFEVRGYPSCAGASCTELESGTESLDDLYL